MEFDIHLFAVVRVNVTGVQAPDAKCAAANVETRIDLNSLFNSRKQQPHAGSLSQTEYEDEITHVLVEPAGNSSRRTPVPVTCFEPFRENDGTTTLTEVPFDKVSTHVAVIVDGGNVQSVITNRPCQVLVLDHDHARESGYDVDEELDFHESEVDPWLHCEQEFRNLYAKEKSDD